MVAEGQGRRPAPKARAEGALENLAFLDVIDAFSKRKNSIPSAHFPGGRLRRTSPAGAFGALPRRAPSAHTPTVQASAPSLRSAHSPHSYHTRCPNGRLRRLRCTLTLRSAQAMCISGCAPLTRRSSPAHSLIPRLTLASWPSVHHSPYCFFCCALSPSSKLGAMPFLPKAAVGPCWALYVR